MSRPAVPVVSVIVPTMNRPVELGQALGSIAGQDGIDLAEVEVIVVNDGGASVEPVIAKARDRGLPVTAVNHPLGWACRRPVTPALNALAAGMRVPGRR